MLSPALLNKITNETNDIVSVNQRLVARSQMARWRLEQTCQQAYLVLEQCRVEAAQRVAARSGTPCKAHIPYLALAASRP